MTEQVHHYAASDYLRGFLNLLPRGRAWNKLPSSNMVGALSPLMPTYESSGLAAENLILDVFPASTTTLLPDWQASLGLPDDCATADATSVATSTATTIVQRNQVVAKFIGNGGATAQFITDYAAALGYTITVSGNVPFRAGQSRVGDKLHDDAAAYWIVVHAPVAAVTLFHAGLSQAGDRLGEFGNRVLECEIRRIAQAHLVVTFDYDETA